MRSRYVIERVGELLEDKGYNVIDQDADEVIAWFQIYPEPICSYRFVKEQEKSGKSKKRIWTV